MGTIRDVWARDQSEYVMRSETEVAQRATRNKLRSRRISNSAFAAELRRLPTVPSFCEGPLGAVACAVLRRGAATSRVRWGALSCSQELEWFILSLNAARSDDEGLLGTEILEY